MNDNSWRNKNIIIWYVDRFYDYHIPAHAAQVVFYMIFSFLPFLIFLINFIRFTPITEEFLVSAMDLLLPTTLMPTFTSWIHEVYNTSFGAVLSITSLVLLWSGSRGFSCITYTFHDIFQVKKFQNFFFRRFLSLIYMLLFLVMIITGLLLLVYGNHVTRIFSLASYTGYRLMISFLIFTIYFTLLFTFTPIRTGEDRNHNGFFKQLPGAALASFMWVLFSFLFSLFNSKFFNPGNLYGSLTSIVLVFLWLYYCIVFLFIGALLNQYLMTHNNRIDLKGTLQFIRLLRKRKIKF